VKYFVLLFAYALSASAEAPPRIPAPLYTPSSVVNAANYKAGSLAPNAIGTLYGRDLAFVTRSLASEDLYNGTLPTTLLGTGVRLLINRTLAFLYFVSPSQVNFLVPSTLAPGPVDIELSLDGRYGEAVRVQLAEFSPALFPLDPETVLATRIDGSAITYERPARPGEVIILYATGLGATKPRLPAGQIPTGIAWLDKLADFRVTLNGETLDRSNLLYAGAAPGFAGLYQINLRLPDNTGRNPELRIGFKEVMSPAEARLPVEGGNP
jgi:uncharacterized protein (TIGR03437 family)